MKYITGNDWSNHFKMDEKKGQKRNYPVKFPAVLSWTTTLLTFPDHHTVALPEVVSNASCGLFPPQSHMLSGIISNADLPEFLMDNLEARSHAVTCKLFLS